MTSERACFDMKTKIEDLKSCRKLLKIEVSPEEIASAYDEVYKEIGKVAKIPGFRVGKVPRKLLETYHRETATEEALKSVIPQYYQEALEDADLEPVAQPEFGEVKFGESGRLTFEAKVEVKPKFKLKDYKGLKLKKKNREVAQADIDRALADLRDSCATFQTLEEAAVESGHYIVCDLEWFVEGKSTRKKENAWLAVDEKSLPKELFSSLVGARPGEKRKISVDDTLKESSNPEHAGKPVNFEVQINQIKKKNLPPLDHEFVKELGSFQSLDELKKGVEKELVSKNERLIRQDLEDQLIEQLLKQTNFEVPNSLIEGEIKESMEDARRRLLKEGYKNEQILKEQKQMEPALRVHATKQVRLFFILSTIAKQEKISATDEELDRLLESMARQMGQEPDKAKEDWIKKGLMERLRWQLIEAKVMEFLLKEAKIEDSG